MQFTPEHEALRNAVAAFVTRECAEYDVAEWDRDGRFPMHLLAKMGEAGWPGLALPTSVGGGGAGAIELAVVAEELSRASYDIATCYGLSAFTAMNVARHGTEELQQRYLPDIISADRRFAVAITEPGSGSDAAALRLRGRVDGDEIALDGQKTFCSGAHLPGTSIAVVCRTSNEERRQDGLTVVLVPNDAPGLTIRRLETMGRRIFGTNELFFDGVRARTADVVGTIGGGWKVVTEGLLLERMFIAASYLGSMASLLDMAVGYAKQRQQFGTRIGDFQAISHMLADAATQVAAARALTYSVAAQIDAGNLNASAVSMAKVFGAEAWMRVADIAMQVAGGVGYVIDSPIQRHFRDARAAGITAGTSQIQRDLIARELGLHSRRSAPGKNSQPPRRVS